MLFNRQERLFDKIYNTYYTVFGLASIVAIIFLSSELEEILTPEQGALKFRTVTHVNWALLLFYVLILNVSVFTNISFLLAMWNYQRYEFWKHWKTTLAITVVYSALYFLIIFFLYMQTWQYLACSMDSGKFNIYIDWVEALYY